MNLFTKSKLLIVALSASSFIQAQSFTGGILVGPSMSNLSGVTNASKGIDKAKMKVGFAQGVFVKYDANAKWAVSFGFINSPKGATYEGSVKDSSANRVGTSQYSYTDNINYFELPLLVHYKFASADSKIKPYVSLGISTGIRYSAKTTVDYKFTGKIGNVDSTITNTQPIYNYYKRANVDYGLVGGAGVTYDINSKFSLGLDARYTVGLVDINETKKTGLKTKNSNLNVFLSLGYKFWNDAPAKEEEKK